MKAMSFPGLSRLMLVLAALSVAAPAYGALSPPAPLAPADGAALEALPAFAWAPVTGADHYEFEIAADPGFNSPVLGFGYDQFSTRNTRATLRKTVPNGDYWWRVRAVDASGGLGAWAPAQAFTKAWNTRPVPLSPIDGDFTSHPMTPLRLEWTSVPHAREYLVSIATDPALGSLVTARAVKTESTSFTLPGLLAAGTYYWGVTPLDPAGNRGAPSQIASFTWVWPSETTPQVDDVLPEHDEVFDPLFSWDLVPGAVRYEVEIYSADQPDLKVCCTGTTITNALAPTVLFKDNSYFWRVRAIDAAGYAGTWNDGPDFTKSFANGMPSVQNLHIRDHLGDPGTDLAPEIVGYQTEVPILTWDPVPGAPSYQVEVTPYDAGRGLCNWTAPPAVHWRNTTATTAWTPLGDHWNGIAPYLDRPNVSNDSLTSLVRDTAYCARVRPRDVDSTIIGNFVYGDYTYLNAEDEPAFVWTGYPAGGTCSPSCTNNYLGSDDYLLPARGDSTGRMPLLTWSPLAGKGSYFVIVAKDPDFHTIVDYAFTQVPAYAPRSSFDATAYPDETTFYYWAVLPATDHGGNGAVGNPGSAAPASFRKLSEPPELREPATAEVADGRPLFRWSAVEAARRYRLQVSSNPTFAGCGAILSSGCLENVVTDSTGYAAATTYPGDTQVYWRVRGEDEKTNAMVWSATGSFVSRLPRAQADDPDPASGSFIPSASWAPVQGAASYDLEVDMPNGQHQPISGSQAAAFTPVLVWGTGIWKWRVRANFANAPFGTVPGPWSRLVQFTRTIPEPAGAATSAGPDPHVVVSWLPAVGAGNGIKQYKLQFATQPDFAAPFDQVITENTSFAPLLSHFAYAAGGTFYWRVAAMDGSNVNTGDFTLPQSFTLPMGTAARLPSSVTARISKTASRIRVRGSVSPAHPGERVTVTLFRRRNGSFVRLVVKRPPLSAVSAYSTSFDRPRPGKCKVTATFGGDADHRPATRGVVFAC
jgi:hypothetical protein